MYSWEIYNFLQERNYYIGGDDLLKVISTQENPQLKYIKFNAFNNIYEMWDNENNYFSFKAMPYEEAQKKNLVKCKKLKK